MTGLIAAWLVGEGLMCYRLIARERRPPLPSELATTSGLFVLLALLAEAQPQLAAYLAWGFDAAAFLSLWPTGLVMPKSANAQKKTETKGTAAAVPLKK